MRMIRTLVDAIRRAVRYVVGGHGPRWETYEIVLDPDCPPDSAYLLYDEWIDHGGEA